MLLPLAVLAFVAIVTGVPVPSEWFDLTYNLENSTIHYPVHTAFRHTLKARIQTASYYWYAYDFLTSEHMGTHMDAPRHCSTNTSTWTIENVPLSSVMGDAVVVDMRTKANANKDAQLMPSDLEDWEKEHGRIPDGAIVLLMTGWGKYWGNYDTYMGTNDLNQTLMHWPGIHLDSAKWLVDNRKMKMFGIDCMSIDYGQTKKFEVHMYLLNKNIPGIENVANLEKLPATGLHVIALPLKINGGSGSPIRLIATIKKDKTQSNAGTTASSGSLAIYISVMVAVLSKLI